MALACWLPSLQGRFSDCTVLGVSPHPDPEINFKNSFRTWEKRENIVTTSLGSLVCEKCGGTVPSFSLWNISHRTKLDFSRRITMLEWLIEKSEAAIFNDVVIVCGRRWPGGYVVRKGMLIWSG